ncbi:MAG: VTT domain-containing protein [Myxococcota bacterium]|nr:VTT domain-containing protein [Myxococcota bacterium]MEC8423537.1 VTT domain-containing protein [Myxococcota bacterium]
MTDPTDSASPAAAETVSPWRTAWKLAVGFVVVFLIVSVLGAWFKDPVVAFGTAVVDRYGLPGLALSVWLVDMFPTPMSYVWFMTLGRAGGISFMAVFGASAVASYLAGLTGFGIGRMVGMPPRLARWMERRHPRIRRLLDEHGVWGLTLISVLPFPLALGSWTAGAIRLPPSKAALALLVRFPKTFVYVLMIEQGLRVGSG